MSDKKQSVRLQEDIYNFFFFFTRTHPPFTPSKGCDDHILRSVNLLNRTLEESTRRKKLLIRTGYLKVFLESLLSHPLKGVTTNTTFKISR